MRNLFKDLITEKNEIKALGGIQTHNLGVARHMPYRCTTATPVKMPLIRDNL